MRNKKPVAKAKVENNAAKDVKAPVVTAPSAVASKADAKVEDSAVKTEVPEVEKKEEPAKETAPVKTEAPVVEKEEEAPIEKKRRGRKPADKTDAKKPVAKKAAKKVEKEVIQEVYFEYMGDQILSNDLVERIKEAYKNEGHRVSSIKTLRVYVNPEDRKAYYVINDKAEGKYVEF